MTQPTAGSHGRRTTAATDGSPRCGSRVASARPRGESNFDRWMANMRRATLAQREFEEGLAILKQQQVQKVDKTPMLQNSSKKAAQRVVRDASEVARIFNHFDSDRSGTIEPHEFMPLLSKLMRQPTSELDKAQVWKTWDAVDRDGSGSINFDEFQEWYCGTFDVERIGDFRSFINSDIVPEEQRGVRDVATKLGIDFVEIEKIWKEFRAVDTDASGVIDYDEFAALIQQQLAPEPGGPGVPEKVVNKFWLDVDSDNTGTITFEEFAVWYLRTLQGETSPMEQYYHTIGRGLRKSVFMALDAGQQ
mmetsp:Transcript_59211/g.178993  ORF Transcript_59211/g.178993 Transcript_59211/m.178993 type:complete len:305 (-) Transcript_59211:109-1023(-)